MTTARRRARRAPMQTNVQSPRLAAARPPFSVLIVVPSLDGGAADAGAVELTRILVSAGNRAIVVSRAGRLAADVTAAGGEFIALDVAATIRSPCCAMRRCLTRLARERGCEVIHALGRAAAWSASIAARRRSIPLRDQLVQGLPRAESVQALLQRRDGARRPGRRGERADRATDARPLRHAVAAHRRGAVERRSRSLRSRRA